jgi:hypothetical protein
MKNHISDTPQPFWSLSLLGVSVPLWFNSSTPKTPFAPRKIMKCLAQRRFIEIGPAIVGHPQFGVGNLPPARKKGPEKNGLDPFRR